MNRLERKNEPILLIGNKDDLRDKEKVSKKEALELARRYGLHFLSTSAKTGSNVEEAFNTVTKTILESQLAK